MLDVGGLHHHLLHCNGGSYGSYNGSHGRGGGQRTQGLYASSQDL
jgi:hypothetical protein